MEVPSLSDFSLVGGTALALRYGHRTSIDIDLFTSKPFDVDYIVEEIITLYKNDFIIEGKPAKFGIFGFIKNIKVDLVHYPHPIIRPLVTERKIRMYSDEDIIAMKIQATLGRGKKKDFWDIAELLEKYTLDDFIHFHQEKYKTQHLLITVPQAITYFADAENSKEPMSLKGQTWQGIKQKIQEKAASYFR